jgi:hypothetical protein
MVELLAWLPPCTIGMKACSGAHHWARSFGMLGHDVKLMTPKFVAPLRLSSKRGRKDAVDVQARCEAVQRHNLRFVPIQSEQEQAEFMMHRARQGLLEQRTVTINRVRGLLSYMGDFASHLWLNCRSWFRGQLRRNQPRLSIACDEGIALVVRTDRATVGPTSTGLESLTAYRQPGAGGLRLALRLSEGSGVATFGVNITSLQQCRYPGAPDESANCHACFCSSFSQHE